MARVLGQIGGSSEGSQSNADLVVRGARIVPIDRAAPGGVVDMRVAGGRVVEVGTGVRPDAGDQVLDADGRWVIPGLWDAHVHLTQWALLSGRLDTSAATCAEEVLALVRARVAARGDRERAAYSANSVVEGYGHRTATWPRQPTVAELDAVSGPVPVVLVSGDAHHGWLNSAALARFGLPPREGVVAEDEWYPIFARLGELTSHAATEMLVRQAVMAAHARGIVGVVDLEWGDAPAQWQARYAAGLRSLRVRAGVYADRLDATLAAGRRSGDLLVPGQELLTMGPFKVISDGSLNTRTAFCHEPYVDGLGADAGRGVGTRGALNLDPADLTEALRRATRGGLDVAVHAIGDAALDVALAAVASAGARGSIEHAQLVCADAPARMAALGLTASVQPAHLLDDREAIAQCWPDRSDRCYAFRALLDAGAPLALGSDAPVSPLDPWLAMAAAVHRTADTQPSWHPEQALTVREALAASVDGQGTLRVGSRGDLVLLDADPLGQDPSAVAEHAAYLRGMPVAATLVAGELVWATADFGSVPGHE
ncbi:MAG: amidohydrolase family protein [Dermatophilaceae bacterium]